jgi:hypothetical protein
VRGAWGLLPGHKCCRFVDLGRVWGACEMRTSGLAMYYERTIPRDWPKNICRLYDNYSYFNKKVYINAILIYTPEIQNDTI